MLIATTLVNICELALIFSNCSYCGIMLEQWIQDLLINNIVKGHVNNLGIP
jgi:hypothetical protein